MISQMTRREVLVASGAAMLAGCSVGGPPAQKARVTILKAPAYDQNLYSIVRQLLEELSVRGKHVVLKPNLVEFDASRPVNTHPIFAAAALEGFRSLGAASVRIAEGPGHRRDALDIADAAGYFREIPGFEELFCDLNLDAVERVPLTQPYSKLRELYLPRTLLGADLVVSLAKMKTHHWVGATLSMKNFFGTVPGGVYGWPKNILHWSGIPECISDLHTVFNKHFGLIDGVYGMQGNGPIQGDAKFCGVIAGSRDLPALDATCCRIMGMDPSRLKYLEYSAKAGQLQAENVEQSGETIASVQTDFELFGDFREWRLRPVI
jgi:uncharacterized protein (DUF362 family)